MIYNEYKENPTITSKYTTNFVLPKKREQQINESSENFSGGEKTTQQLQCGFHIDSGIDRSLPPAAVRLHLNFELLWICGRELNE